MIRVLLADDHPLVRAGIKQTLSINKEIEVIAEANNGSEAVALIKQHEPDIAVIDVNMPVKSGIDVLSELSDAPVSTKVILLTMYKNRNYFYQAVSFGAKGYVLKETSAEDLIDAVENVANGKVFISGAFSQFLENEKKQEDERRIILDSINSMTDMEKKVMSLIAEWKTNNEIAEALFISPRTVGTHRTNISNKLNLRGSNTIVRFAIENRELF